MVRNYWIRFFSREIERLDWEKLKKLDISFVCFWLMLIYWIFWRLSWLIYFYSFIVIEVDLVMFKYCKYLVGFSLF